jgi:hypothetical protein
MNARKVGKVAKAHECMERGKARLCAVHTTGLRSAGSIFNHIRQ